MQILENLASFGNEFKFVNLTKDFIHFNNSSQFLRDTSTFRPSVILHPMINTALVKDNHLMDIRVDAAEILKQ